MKQSLVVSMCIMLLVLSSIFPFGRVGGNAVAAESVVLACVRSDGTFIVKRLSASAGVANVPAKGDACAQALASFLDEGMEVKNVQPYIEGTQDGALYTLVTVEQVN